MPDVGGGTKLRTHFYLILVYYTTVLLYGNFALFRTLGIWSVGSSAGLRFIPCRLSALLSFLPGGTSSFFVAPAMIAAVSPCNAGGAEHRCSSYLTCGHTSVMSSYQRVVETNSKPNVENYGWISELGSDWSEGPHTLHRLIAWKGISTTLSNLSDVAAVYNRHTH